MDAHETAQYAQYLAEEAHKFAEMGRKDPFTAEAINSFTSEHGDWVVTLSDGEVEDKWPLSRILHLNPQYIKRMGDILCVNPAAYRRY